MPDERAETLAREYKTRFPERVGTWTEKPEDKEAESPAPEPAPEKETQPQPEETASEGEKTPPKKEEHMIPKARFDEALEKERVKSERISQELMEARTKLKELEENPPTKVPEEEQEGYRILEDYYSKKTAPIQRELENIKVRLEVDQFLKDFPEARKDPELIQAAISKVKQNPTYSISDAYRVVSFDSFVSRSRNEGKEEALEDAQKKQSARGDSSGRRTGQRSVDELLADKSIPLSEIEKLLPKA